MKIQKNDIVRFLGEKWRVRKVFNGGRDAVIQNVEGYKMTVTTIGLEIDNG